MNTTTSLIFLSVSSFMKHFLQTSLFLGAICMAATTSCRKPTDSIDVEQEVRDSIPSTDSTGGIFLIPAFLHRYTDIFHINDEISRPPADSPLLPWLQKEAASYQHGNLQLSGRAAPMLAFGDGMSAGWTDGGLYRAGQQTAFPNLVAHQMGIKDFKSPLFDIAHGNGTGYLILQNQNGQPFWSEVTNNLAIIKRTNVPQLVPYLGGDVENMSEPKVTQGGISGTLSPKENGWSYGNDGRGWSEDMIFFWRMQPNADKYKDTYWDMMNRTLESKKPAIVLSSFGFDYWTERVLKNEEDGLDWNNASSESYQLAISVGEKAQKSGAQAVVYTLPAFKHLAYYVWQSQYATPFNPENLDRESPTATNRRMRKEAEEKSLLVVDLEKLFDRISAGKYVTDDGLKISGKPGGNFFSSDGIYPSAIGNAVIANETIKVINAHFHSQIPLINITEFASYWK